jgi:hypothetical protein
MTWLPISLKNAAKCDKWYQLQNLSITESLNANGALKKPPVVNSEHAMISVSNKNQKKQSRFCAWRDEKCKFQLLSVQWLFCAYLRGRDNERNPLCFWSSVCEVPLFREGGSRAGFQEALFSSNQKIRLVRLSREGQVSIKKRTKTIEKIAFAKSLFCLFEFKMERFQIQVRLY